MARDYEYQWQSIMNSSMFAEEAIISDDETVSISVNGIFFSGSYEEDSPAAYAPKRLVAKECFQVSSLSFPEEIPNPWDMLVGMDLILVERNLKFRINEVSGKRGGMLTLYLQEKRDGE